MRFHWTHAFAFCLGAVVGVTIFAVACPPTPVPGKPPAPPSAAPIEPAPLRPGVTPEVKVEVKP